jgi:hypothetical protein
MIHGSRSNPLSTPAVPLALEASAPSVRGTLPLFPDPRESEVEAVGNAILATGGTLEDARLALAHLPGVTKRAVWAFLAQSLEAKTWPGMNEEVAALTAVQIAIRDELWEIEAVLNLLSEGNPNQGGWLARLDTCERARLRYGTARDVMRRWGFPS